MKLKNAWIKFSSLAALLGSIVPATAVDDFAPLSCNSLLDSAPCDSWKSLYGTSAVHNSLVTIPCGECVIMDHDGPTLTLEDGINILGKLVFPDNYNLNLHTTMVVVQGELHMSATKPVDGTPSITFFMIGDVDKSYNPHDNNAMNCGGADCNAGKKAITVAGGKVDLHGLPDGTPTWTHLYDAIGDYNNPDTIVVEDSVASKWAAGADILITSHTNTWDGHQVRSITDVRPSNEAGFVELVLDLAILRPTTIKESPDFATEVALLSRNILFEGGPDATLRHGGHFWVFHTPTVQQTIEGVEFKNFGQQGSLGRYPIHFHFCRNVAGAVVAKNTVRESNQRCVVVHGTDELLIQENVAFDTKGHCFFTEDGIETHNSFIRNLGSYTRVPEETISNQETDDEPSTFWITNPTNTWFGNVAAGSEDSGFWWEMLKRGARANDPDYAHIVADRDDLILFAENVVHSCGKNQGTRGAFRMYPNGYKPDNPQVLSRNKGYRNRARRGLFIHRCDNLLFEDGLYADNDLDVDIDRAEGITIRNFTIIGESDSFKELALRENNMDVCNGGIKRGLDVHSWKREIFIGNAVVENVRFQDFVGVNCDEVYTINIDHTSQTDNIFDLLTSFEDIDFGGADEGYINFCKALDAGIVNSYLTDKDGSLRPALHPTPSGFSTALTYPNMMTFVEPMDCTTVSDRCYAYCDTCFRSFRFFTEPINTVGYWLKVCKKDDLSTCMNFPSGRRANGSNDVRTRRSFLAHVPPGSYIGIFLDDNLQETSLEVLDTFNETQCPGGFGGVTLEIFASMEDAAATAAPSIELSAEPSATASEEPSYAPSVYQPLTMKPLRLYKADSSKEYLGKLENGDTIDTSQVGTELTAKARFEGGTITSVDFYWDSDEPIHTDTSNAFFIMGNPGGDFIPFTGFTETGVHNLTVVGHAADIGASLAVTLFITVTDGVTSAMPSLMPSSQPSVYVPMSVRNFRLFDADTTLHIKRLDTDPIIELSELSTNNLTIRVAVDGEVNSVSFYFDGSYVFTDDNPAFFLMGNQNGYAPYPGLVVPGLHVLEAELHGIHGRIHTATLEFTVIP